MRSYLPLWIALGCSATALVACSNDSASGASTAPAVTDDSENAATPTPTSAPPAQTPTPTAPSAKELRELHMRDRLALATQARDALIRGQLVEATGALTWFAHRSDSTAIPGADPFLQRLRQHARTALGTSDLRVAAQEVGRLAATCGECHTTTGHSPAREPSGLEDLDSALTVTTHMHGYLWATETLWEALVADSALWETGVTTLATLTPPSKPAKLAAGFAAVQAWAKSAGAATTGEARGKAYGELLATCGTCHLANAVVPGRNP